MGSDTRNRETLYSNPERHELSMIFQFEHSLWIMSQVKRSGTLNRSDVSGIKGGSFQMANGTWKRRLEFTILEQTTIYQELCHGGE